jgi:hypothetical protein
LQLAVETWFLGSKGIRLAKEHPAKLLKTRFLPPKNQGSEKSTE